MLVDLPCSAGVIAARLRARSTESGSDYGETARTFNRNATFRVYLVHPKVRSMSAAFRVYLLHLDNDLSCSGSARASAQHERNVQNVSSTFGQRQLRWEPLGHLGVC